MGLRTTLARWGGLIFVGSKRALTRATTTARNRALFSILGVAIAIALLVVVTSIGIGLATGTTVYDDDIDYWIVPESDETNSPLVATSGTQLGTVHPTTDRINAIDGVEGATPVLSTVLRVETDTADEFVLVVGIIDAPAIDRVAGLTTAGLTPGDPYYDDGSYDGERTGEVIVSAGAADVLAVSSGDSMTAGGSHSFTVTAVDTDPEGAIGDIPTALVQLSELQTITGADANDQADQFVVKTNAPGVSDSLADVYPKSSVYSRGELLASETLETDLPLALALTAFVIAVGVGVLFIVTTMGLEIVADKRQLATMSAMGLSTRSQLAIISVQTLTTTGIGGLVGGVFGLGVIQLVNAVSLRTLTTEPIALFHPLLAVYGIVVSLVIGAVSLVYLLVLTKRVSGGVPT